MRRVAFSSKRGALPPFSRIRAGIRLLVTGLALTFSSQAPAAFICRNVNKLRPPDTGAKHDIEVYMQDRYQEQAGHIRIGRLDGDFFLVWPEGDCAPCYYHLVRRRASDVMEFMAYDGAGAILSTDDLSTPYNRFLKDSYSYWFLMQRNKTYLYIGIPRSEGVPFVEPPSPEARLPVLRGPC